MCVGYAPSLPLPTPTTEMTSQLAKYITPTTTELRLQDREGFPEYAQVWKLAEAGCR